MSNIFGPICRQNAFGKLSLDTGIGEITDGSSHNHLRINPIGQVYAVVNGEIDHYGAGLPFDLHGRLVVSNSPVDYWDQGIPFTVSGAVSTSLAGPDYHDQGTSFASSGEITQDV